MKSPLFPWPRGGGGKRGLGGDGGGAIPNQTFSRLPAAGTVDSAEAAANSQSIHS